MDPALHLTQGVQGRSRDGPAPGQPWSDSGLGLLAAQQQQAQQQQQQQAIRQLALAGAMGQLLGAPGGFPGLMQPGGASGPFGPFVAGGINPAAAAGLQGMLSMNTPEQLIAGAQSLFQAAMAMRGQAGAVDGPAGLGSFLAAQQQAQQQHHLGAIRDAAAADLFEEEDDGDGVSPVGEQPPVENPASPAPSHNPLLFPHGRPAR